MDRNQLYWVLSVAGLVIVLILIASFVPPGKSSNTSTSTPQTSTSTVTTGSTAGSGPGNIGGITNPGAPTSSVPFETALLQLGATLNINGVNATATSVVEDSRCPIDVQCIQAGTVRVNVKLSYKGVSVTRTFTLGVPQSAFGYTALLKEVRPTKLSTETIRSTDYRFLFVVTKP
jgi:hypothetical protein